VGIRTGAARGGLRCASDLLREWCGGHRPRSGSFGHVCLAGQSPARRPRCGAPRLRATRGGRYWIEGIACGPAAFGVSSRGSAASDFRPVLVPARRSFRSATPAARRRAPRGTPHHGRRAARCGRDPLTQTTSSVPSAPSPRGAWAGGGVPRAADVRRRARQARQGGGPGSEWPEGTTQPSLSLPARKLRARREHEWPNDARRDGREVEVRRRPTRRRRGPGLPGAGKDAAD
jgi:hypothetical protein